MANNNDLEDDEFQEFEEDDVNDEEESREEESHNERNNASFSRRSLTSSDIQQITFVLQSAKADLQIIGGERLVPEGYAGKITCTRKSKKKIDFSLMLSRMGFQDIKSKEALVLTMAMWEQSVQWTKNLALYDPALRDDVESDLNDGNNGFFESLVDNWSQHGDLRGDKVFSSIFKHQIIKEVSGQIFIARSLLTL